MIPKFVPIFPQIAVGARKQFITNARCVFYGFLSTNTNSINRTYESSSGSRERDPSLELINTTERDRSCKQFTTIGKIFSGVSAKSFGGENKVSVIGLDDIGIATAFALLSKGITHNICMIDMNEEILQGEHMDLQSSAIFLDNPKIISSKDFAASRDSRVCVVTTGTYKGRAEHEPEYVARNAGILRAIIPTLSKYSPDTIFIMASDPVDVLSYVTWRLSGAPKHRVIGTGTILDTARFRYMLSDRFGVSPVHCHADIIGEHGENSVPVWSTVNVAGVRIKDVNPQVGTDRDPEMWNEIYQDAVKSEDLTKQLKGSISWSMALAISEICKAIFTNSNYVTPVSTYVKGEHSIRNEIFLSLPCVIGKTGITDIIRQSLTENEIQLLRRGAENIAQMQECANKILS